MHKQWTSNKQHSMHVVKRMHMLSMLQDACLLWNTVKSAYKDFAEPWKYVPYNWSSLYTYRELVPW